jgi:hypothetical protein
VATSSNSDKLIGFLHANIAKRKKKIHPEHSARFNHDMQLHIDCIEWVLEKIEENKIPNDRLDGHIRSTIKNLEKRKDKAMIRSDTDDLWIKMTCGSNPPVGSPPISHPMPSLFQSNPWGSGGSTANLLSEMSPQFRSGGYGGIHTSGYEGSQLACCV